MKKISCTQVRGWVEEGVRTGRLELPDPDLYVHVAECPICRGALALLIAQATPVSASLVDISHDECLADLAAYIDAEDRNTTEALEDYPQVWWHLWHCATCATTYSLTRSLLSENRDDMPTTATTNPPVGVLEGIERVLLTLSRSFLNLALPTLSPQYGVLRGATSAETVIIDEVVPGGEQVRLSVLQRDDATWDVKVRVYPVVAGVIKLRFGVDEWYAPVSSGGIAVISSVPESVMSDSSGSGVELLLVGTSGPDTTRAS